MTTAKRISAELQAAGRGGHVVALDDDVVTSLGLKHNSRVKGTIAKTPYRSSTARYGGVMYLGVHKATVARAGLTVGDTVDVTIETDLEPREVDVPADLASALEENAQAKAAWNALSPSHQREYARAVAEAKRATTRARRIDKTIEVLLRRT